MIIGICGKYCSGKDTAAAYLMQKGFTHLSLSDVLRAEAKRRNLPIDRETLIALGNELRAKHGPGVLAQLALNGLESQNVVVSSIRNPSEVQELRKREDFILIALDASQQIRWERMKHRNAQHNISTLEQFKALEQAEQSSDPLKQQLHLVIENADMVLQNEAEQQDLFEQLELLFLECVEP